MRNKRTIPEIRVRLLELANNHGIAEIKDLVQEMYRNPPKRKAKTRSPKLTAEKAQKIREYADANPKLHLADIAAKFNMNPGRVSEAINDLK